MNEDQKKQKFRRGVVYNADIAKNLLDHNILFAKAYDDAYKKYKNVLRELESELGVKIHSNINNANYDSFFNIVTTFFVTEPSITVEINGEEYEIELFTGICFLKKTLDSYYMFTKENIDYSAEKFKLQLKEFLEKLIKENEEKCKIGVKEVK